MEKSNDKIKGVVSQSKCQELYEPALRYNFLLRRKSLSDLLFNSSIPHFLKLQAEIKYEAISNYQSSKQSVKY